MFEELGIPFNRPLPIFEDNNSCIKLASRPYDHKTTNHIDIRHHFIRDSVKSRDIELKPISSKKQRADLLTKALPFPQFAYLKELSGMKNLSNFSIELGGRPRL